ncbi:hypothetical protein [Halovenus marina]|uniref:hypothetical protein n=1 Tax=Halovenus marina TaxID=3396621 RepID=UPI003F565A3A
MKNEEALVYILVEAPSRKIAVQRAKAAMEDVIDAVSRPYETFQEYKMFQGEDAQDLRETFGEKPAAAPLKTNQGKQLLDEAWEQTEQNFNENLEAVRELLDQYSNEELMKDAEHVRLRFLRLGTTIGPSVPIYTETSYPIRDRDELEHFIDAHGEIWIVPFVGVS